MCANTATTCCCIDVVPGQPLPTVLSAHLWCGILCRQCMLHHVMCARQHAKVLDTLSCCSEAAPRTTLTCVVSTISRGPSNSSAPLVPSPASLSASWAVGALPYGGSTSVSCSAVQHSAAQCSSNITVSQKSTVAVSLKPRLAFTACRPECRYAHLPGT